MNRNYTSTTDPELQHTIAYTKLVARKYWNTLPDENKAGYGLVDYEQDLLLHFLSKRDKYNTGGGDFKKWMRTVIYNKAITISTKQWDQKFLERQRGEYVLSSFYDNSVVAQKVTVGGVPEVILVSERTPLKLLINLENNRTMAKQVAKKLVAATVTETEVRELCERFELEYDAADVEASLVTCIEFALGDMPEDDYNALPDDVQARLSTIADAIDAEQVTIAKDKGKAGKGKAGKGKAKKEKVEKEAGPGRGRRNPDGPVAKIREAFDEGKGIVTVKAMTEHLAATFPDLVCAEATVKTQIGKLRKQYSLVNDAPRGGFGATGSGILKKIREHFADGKGIVTVELMIAALQKDGIDFSPATVRTQMAKLRKEFGLSGTFRRTSKAEKAVNIDDEPADDPEDNDPEEEDNDPEEEDNNPETE